MARLEPSTTLTPTSNWRLGFQSVGGRGSSMKPVACFNVSRPAEKAGSRVGGASPVAAFVQRIVKATLASRSDSAFVRSFICVRRAAAPLYGALPGELQPESESGA